MNTRFATLIALTSLAAVFTGVTARAQSNPPVLTNQITEIELTTGVISQIIVTNGGMNYTVAPSVTFTGGGGTGASATANIDAASGDVTSITLVSGGSGYVSAPTVSFSGGGTGSPSPTGAAATAVLNSSGAFMAPFQNEVFGPAGEQIVIFSLATGTEPVSGFVYSLTVDGQSIGSTLVQPPGTPGVGGFVPPLPGVYTITSTTSDGFGNTAISAAVRYFATGTAIVSPEAGGTPFGGVGTLIPLGSSVIVQATSTPADGFVSRIDFYTDWNNSTSSGTLIGSSTNYPYSLIYTPAGPVGTAHIVKALAYDNTGTLVPSTNLLDEVTFTMTTANPSPLPTCVLVTPANGSLVQIPDYAGNPTAAIPIIVTAGASAGAEISRVELYINGVLFATDSSYPYTFTWSPKVTGVYKLTALAYDNLGNVVASTTSTSPTATPAPTSIVVEAAPVVALTSPGNGGTLNSGAPTSVTAVATDTNLDASGNAVSITQVQFFQDGVFVGVAPHPTTPGGDSYTVSFSPVQLLVNGIAQPSVITAVATDSLGFSGTSPSVTVNVTSGGTGGGVVAGIPPTISVTAPTTGTSVIVNNPVTLSAAGTALNGNIASVSFLVDNTILKTVTQYPYSVAWTPQNLGTYQITASVTDNLGDKSPSTNTVTVTVVPEPPPTVNITGPLNGGTITAGSPVTLTASASSPTGTIASVQFFENGLPIGTVTEAPYTVSFTPTSAGIYTFTAIATDNAGETTTTTPSIVEAFPEEAGLGTTAYFGQYQGLTDGGKFAFMVVDGSYGTYIAYSNAGTGKPAIAFYSDIPVSSGGALSSKSLNGEVSQTGVSGNLVPSNDLFIGAAVQAGSVAVAGGYYTGSIQGQAGSQITGILGADGELMVYIASGSNADVAYGSVDSSGNVNITTADNNALTGTINPSTGFFTGTYSGANGGSVIAARVSGGTFSDGLLTNISTRGQVGSGANVMIAGFVVGGTVPKQLLVRAVGPTLSTFNLAGSVAGTQLQVFSGTTLIGSNTGWSSTNSNAAAVTAADLQVGAFALPAGSADSALVGTFAPGSYTAMVAGANGATGIGLVEIYDMDSFTPFTTRKLTNVSTRGQVGTGNNVLIGGFSINGTAPKRVLIRGAGPGLTALNVSGALATPHLQLYNSEQAVIRENYTWQVGNDAGLIDEAEASTGAFTFASGSADSAILIVLPPGTYTAEVSGANSTTGDALVEVYEVP
jgi:hypothetical protein